MSETPALPTERISSWRQGAWSSWRAWLTLAPALAVAGGLVLYRFSSPLDFYDRRIWLTLAVVGSMWLASWLLGALLRTPLVGQGKVLLLVGAPVLLFGLLAPAAWEADDHAKQVPVPAGWSASRFPELASMLGCPTPCTVTAEYDYPRAMAEAGALRDPWVDLLRAEGWTVEYVGDAEQSTLRAPSCWSPCPLHGRSAHLELFGLVDAEKIRVSLVLH